MLEVNGNQFWWDTQIGTYMAQVGDIVYGTHSGHYSTASALALGIGVTLSTDDLIALDAEKIAEPAPDAAVILTKTEFLNRFTLAEREAIIVGSKTAIALEVYLFDLQNADSVYINSQQTIVSLQYLEAAGLLAMGRANQILGIA